MVWFGVGGEVGWAVKLTRQSKQFVYKQTIPPNYLRITEETGRKENETSRNVTKKDFTSFSFF